MVSVTVLLLAVIPTNSLLNARVVGATVTAAAPVPLNWVVCGLFAALSVTVKTPVCRPRTAGVKVTPILQVPPAANDFGASGQFVVSEKLPDADTALIVTGPAVLFVRVTSAGPFEVPTAVLVKLSVAGFSV